VCVCCVCVCVRVCAHARSQALEGFVTHVPIDARAQLESILTLSLANLKYDPNFADDNDDMEEDQDGEEDNEDDEDQ
jgi:hypothetical protein